jgi:hypothetical protein
MRKRGMVVLTALTLLATGLGMNSAGWFKGKHASRHANRPHHHARAQASALNEAAWRHQNFQPLHWRAMLLQR